MLSLAGLETVRVAMLWPGECSFVVEVIVRPSGVDPVV